MSAREIMADLHCLLPLDTGRRQSAVLRQANAVLISSVFPTDVASRLRITGPCIGTLLNHSDSERDRLDGLRTSILRAIAEPLVDPGTMPCVRVQLVVADPGVDALLAEVAKIPGELGGVPGNIAALAALLWTLDKHLVCAERQGVQLSKVSLGGEETVASIFPLSSMDQLYVENSDCLSRSVVVESAPSPVGYVISVVAVASVAIGLGLLWFRGRRTARFLGLEVGQARSSLAAAMQELQEQKEAFKMATGGLRAAMEEITKITEEHADQVARLESHFNQQRTTLENQRDDEATKGSEKARELARQLDALIESHANDREKLEAGFERERQESLDKLNAAERSRSEAEALMAKAQEQAREAEARQGEEEEARRAAAEEAGVTKKPPPKTVDPERFVPRVLEGFSSVPASKIFEDYLGLIAGLMRRMFSKAKTNDWLEGGDLDISKAWKGRVRVVGELRERARKRRSRVSKKEAEEMVTNIGATFQHALQTDTFPALGALFELAKEQGRIEKRLLPSRERGIIKIQEKIAFAVQNDIENIVLALKE